MSDLMPDGPAAFWRAYERASRRLKKLIAQQVYMLDHFKPSHRDRLQKVTDQISDMQATLDAFGAECDERSTTAKKAGIDALDRFFAPRVATLNRQRARQNFRPIIDGYIVIGRRSNGTPILEACHD